MKKLFTLIAATLMAGSLFAQTTLVEFKTNAEDSKGITISGTTDFRTVKMHTNADEVNTLSFNNGYTTGGAFNQNAAKLETEGGFKAGDVVTLAGIINNSDAAKSASVAIFTLDGDKPTVLFTAQPFINGRLVNDEAVVETYTLEADADVLYLGREGKTRASLTLLKVTRGGTTDGIQTLATKVIPADETTYNLAGQRVDKAYKGVVIRNHRKYVQN